MIAILQIRKYDIQTQIYQIAKQLGQSGAGNDELVNKIALLRKEMEGIDEKLAVRYKMLDDANDTINEAKARLAEMKEEHREMLKSYGNSEKHPLDLQQDANKFNRTTCPFFIRPPTRNP